jgi:hypothetical protein
MFLNLHLNCRSLCSKHDALVHLINHMQLPPDLLAVSETWLEQGQESCVNIDRYFLLSNPRKDRQEYINTRVYSSLYVCVDMCYYIFNNKLSIVTSHAIRPSFEGNLC